VEVREGIIEKWLAYCMNQNLNEFMVWRLQLMLRKDSVFSMPKLKKIMSNLRNIDVMRLEKLRLWKIGDKVVDKTRITVDSIFPLLDPFLNPRERQKKHG